MRARAAPHRTYHLGSARHSRCRITTSHAYVAHPWSTSGRGWAGGFSCAFDPYQHCLENARLSTANCVANPAIDPLPQVESRPAQPKGRGCGSSARSGAKSAGPSEQCKRDSHPRDKDRNNKRQVILIEGNNPLHGPPPRLRISEGQLPVPPTASLWISFQHAHCALTRTQRRNSQRQSLKINVSDSEFDAKC